LDDSRAGSKSVQSIAQISDNMYRAVSVCARSRGFVGVQ
jgi:hypothetical protein